jgi:hypothetical protein
MSAGANNHQVDKTMNTSLYLSAAQTELANALLPSAIQAGPLGELVQVQSVNACTTTGAGA